MYSKVGMDERIDNIKDALVTNDGKWRLKCSVVLCMNGVK